ncbi:hypothetical protein OAB59_01685 [Pelagibacteraceae bacterium]|nr:hypothetical protein [Pelagibacteraceae bacterium]
MKIFITILISFIMISPSNSAEEKCTWNILKSNCKTKNISNYFEKKVKQGSSKIREGSQLIIPKKNEF